MGKVYKNDIGTIITIDSGEDLSSATVKKIYFKKPDGTLGNWSASVVDTTKLRYTTEAGDLNMAGTWQFQIYVELPSWQGRGETESYQIYDYFN